MNRHSVLADYLDSVRCDNPLMYEAANVLRAGVELFGKYPERAQLCHDGHMPIIHFDECPLCADAEDTEEDTVGFTVVMIAGQTMEPAKGDEWQEEFRIWYKPKEWLGSHRAAAVFLGMKFRGAERRGAEPT